MGNFITALRLLLAIGIFTAVNSSILCSLCDEMLALVERGDIDGAIAVWDENKGYFSLFVRDAEIDSVSAEIEKHRASTAKGDGNTAGVESGLRDAINEILDSEKVNFGDIF